jgi:uncharacterized protein (DUF433 family)
MVKSLSPHEMVECRRAENPWETEMVITQHIEKTPGLLGGKACIAGHRIRVIDIVVWHEKRAKSADEIVAMFPGITLSDVHAALAYYFDNREEIEADFRGEAQVADGLRAKFPSKLEEKLRG